MRRRVGFEKQYHQKDCGIICLINILKYYEVSISYAEVINNVTMGTHGISMLDMKEFLQTMEIEAAGYKIEDKAQIVESELPVIAQVIRGDELHFVVVYKIKHNKFYLSDPGNGKTIMHKDEFLSEWTGFLFAIVDAKNSKNNLIAFNGINIYSIIKVLMMENKLPILAIVLLAIVMAILNIFTSFYFQIVNSLLNSNLKQLVIVGLITFLLYNVTSYFQFFSQKLSFIFSRQVEQKIKEKYMHKLIDEDYDKIISYELGDLTVRQQDITTVANGVSLLFGIAAHIILLLLFYFLLLSLNVIFSLILFIGSLVYCGIFFAGINPLQEKYKTFMKQKEAFDNALLTVINGIMPIRLLNGQAIFKTELLKKHVSQAEQQIAITNYANGISGLAKSMLEGIRITAISYLFYLVMHNKFDFVIVMSINFLLNHYLASLNSIVTSMVQLSEVGVAIKALNHFFAVVSDTKQKYVLDDTIETIEFQNVSLFYRRNQNILHDISLSIERPQKILLTGRSGSGKTTLINTLIGFHNKYDGSILLNGVNVKDIATQALRESIGVVPAHDYFFQGTIIENLTMKKDIPISKIIHYCEQLGIIDEIMAMDERFETMVLEDGRNLSTGQKKRLSIIRTLLTDADVMVFDEPTANLDTDTRSLIMEYILNINKIVIIISHDDFYKEKIDTIYHVKDGGIVQKGLMIDERNKAIA